MKYLLLLLLATPAEAQIASVYSSKEGSGSRVACPGHRLVDSQMVAAHKTLPCGSRVTVTNKSNGRSVMVTIIDRGPYVKGRVIDLSPGAARSLGFSGLAHVNVSQRH